MNLLFVSNSSYRKHIFRCIQSIVRFPVEGGYNIYILHSDWSDSEKHDFKKAIKSNVNIHFIYVNPSPFDCFPENDRYPKLIYYRIFAAQFLPKDMERILYLDGDITVINPLNELYDTDFQGNYYCACTHVQQMMTKINKYRLGTMDVHPYINSGVLLMNLQQLRVHQNINEVLEYVKKYKNYLLLPDQDIITALYGKKIKIVDTMKYNLSDRVLSLYHLNPLNEKKDINWVRENTVIIHYCGINKPWNEYYMGKLDIFYRELYL